MAKFVLLYSGGGMAATEAERAKSIEAWGAWFGRLGSAVVDGGAPLAAAKSIAPNGTLTLPRLIAGDAQATLAPTGHVNA